MVHKILLAVKTNCYVFRQLNEGLAKSDSFHRHKFQVLNTLSKIKLSFNDIKIFR